MKKLLAAVSVLLLMLCMMTGCASEIAENTVHSADDLEGKTIGVQIGTTGMTFAEDIPDATVDKYNKGADAIQALKQGKVDAVLIDAAPAEYFVEKNHDLSALPDPFVEEEYAIALKKGNDELTEQINLALEELKANGTLARIESNWIGDE